MEYLKTTLSKLHWPIFLTSTVISSFAYFITTTIALRLIGYPPRPAEIISEQPYLPEPLETPMYLASYVLVPILGLMLYPFTKKLLHFLSSRNNRRMMIGSIATLGILAFVGASINNLIPLSTIISYLDSHSLAYIVQFIVSKRILIASLIFAGSVIIWIVVYGFKFKPPLFLAFNPRTEQIMKKILPFGALLLPFLLFHPNFPYDQHHHNYMMGAVNDIFHGKHLLYETFNLYGVLNIYALAMVLKILPYTYQSFTLVLYIAYVGYFFGLYFFLFKWLKSYVWAAIGVVFSIAVTYFLQISPEQSAFEFHNTGPYRYWFYLLIAFMMLKYSRTQSIWIKRIMIGLLSIALVWTFDTGIYLSLAVGITLFVVDWQNITTSQERIRNLMSLALNFLVFTLVVIGCISLINYAIIGSWPNLIHAISGLLDFRSGVGMQAHPIIGFYLLITTTYILMMLWFVRARLQKQPLDPAALFLLTYGIIGFNYYIGFSVWQLLYYSSPPLLLLIIYFLKKSHDTQLSDPNGTEFRIFNATLAALLFYTSAILVIKIPIEFSHRNYTNIHASLTEVPIQQPSNYRDEAMYQDAQTIKKLYPGVPRYPVVHRRSARLLYFLGTSNFFDFYELQSITHQRTLDQMVDALKQDRPPLLIIGTEKNRIVDAFERTLQSMYVKSFSLQTLDIYIPR